MPTKKVYKTRDEMPYEEAIDLFRQSWLRVQKRKAQEEKVQAPALDYADYSEYIMDEDIHYGDIKKELYLRTTRRYSDDD